MSFDLITTWPDSLDYPIFRQFIKQNRSKFQKVIVVMMKANRPKDFNFANFLQNEAFKDQDVTIIDDYEVKGDWRSAAVNAGLAISEASYVWFQEQDFFIKETDTFFNAVIDGLKDSDIVSYRAGDRFHPALMVAKRTLIEKTRKDFGIIPNISDHFSIFIEDVLKMLSLNPNGPQRPTTLTECGLIESQDYYHMNGLTHNYHLVMDGEKKAIYHPAEFMLYNSYARMAQVVQSPEFLGLTFKADLLVTPLTRFFMGNLTR